MAQQEDQYQEQGLFKNLAKLFRSNIIVRKDKKSGMLRVKDVDLTQQSVTSNFVDRYTRIGTTPSFKFAKQQQAAFNMQRIELYKDYELMDSDPIISSALDIYADECTVDNQEGMTLQIKTDNNKLYDILHNLFYDVLNIDFNMWSWIRNMAKYGDLFLQMDILDEHGVVNVKPLSSYEIERLEEHDPSDPSLIEFSILGDKKEMKQEYEVAHFRLLSDGNFLPYGKSMIEGARKIFKQLTLMEDAMLIHRIMRAPEKRIFKVDIGNIPPNEVENFMNKLINKMKKTPVIDQTTGEYNLRYNIQSVTEDFFLPVRGSDSGTSIESLPGMSNDSAIEDIEYLRNKLMAALRIPKAFLGYEEGVGSKATLAAEDVRFSRTIERVQKIVCSELEKIAVVHLYTQGFTDGELLNFELKLTNPSMIHAQEKLELLTQQQELANSLMENKLMSRDWIYDNIFELSDTEKKEIYNQIIEDRKQAFRMEQITMEGNDPFVTGEKDTGGGEGGGAPGGGMGEGQWGGSEKDRFKKDVNPHGSTAQDLSAATSYEYGQGDTKRQFKGGSPLATSKGSTLVAHEGLLGKLKQKFKKNVNDMGLLNEESILDE